MPIKSIIPFISHTLRQERIDSAYDEYVANMLYIVAQRKHTEEGNMWWGAMRDKMNGASGKDDDNRTASDIIKDTLQKHGLKIENPEEERKWLHLIGD